MSQAKTITFFTLLLLLTAFSGQSQSYDFTSYTTEHGLPQNQIVGTFQDSDGFMWFGTNGGGIAKFDGQSFTNFTSRDGLVNNSCYSFYEDADRNVWVGTNDGISVFNLDDPEPNFKTYTGPQGELDHVWVKGMLADHDDQLWMTTNLGVFVKKGDSLTRFHTGNGLTSNATQAITQDHEGNIWIGYDPGGIAKITTNGIANFALPTGMIDFIFDIEVDPYNSLWIACGNHGLIHFDGKTFTQVIVEGKELSAEMRDVAIDQDSAIWFGSMGGIGKIVDYAGDIKTAKPQGIAVNDNLASSIIWKIFIDKDNNKWLGTYGGGIAHIGRENYTLFDRTVGMIDNFMWSVHIDRENRIWAGSIDKGLSIISETNGNHEVSLTFDDHSGLIDNGVQAFYEDDELMWIGTSTGLMRCRLDENNKLLQPTPEEDHQLMSKSIRCFYTMNDGTLLMGTADGLYRVTDNNQSELVSDKLLGHVIYSLDQAPNGTLWIATGSDLFSMDAKGNIREYTTDQGLSNTDIRTVLVGDYGKIWMATGAGMCIYDPEAGIFSTIGYNEGLSSGRLYYIHQDHEKTLWIGSGTGIDLMDMEAYNNSGTIDITHLGKGQGFAEFEANTNVVTESEDGTMWLGSISGLIKYNPKASVIDSIASPTPLITHLAIHDSLVDFNSDIVLTHEENYITIRYVGLQYKNPDEIYYRHRLEGATEIWSPKTKETSAIFSNLDAGTYTFHLKTGLRGREQEEQQTSISFVIQPAFWQTLWFRLLIGFLVIVIISSYFLIRTKVLKEQKLELANQVRQKTQEVVIERDEATRQKDEARHHRKVAEAKKNEILDSISYAKRIQEAILPPVATFTKQFNDCFILYRPKDIVAGDFYWTEKITVDGVDRILFAAADCTGHGVPGAMVSVVCINALNRSVREFKLTDPGEILDKVTQIVLETFDKSEEEVKDGMDIALCSLSPTEMTLDYAGANNPLVIVRGEEILTYKATKQAVGFNEVVRAFTTSSLPLEPEDRIYIFSDGYVDQFGGKKGKKLKSKPFKQLLLSLHGQQMHQQMGSLNKFLEEWRGSLEQVDDVCVIGVQV